MANFSDDSDVNPEEMARMVEELEDLDNTLLGVSTKKDAFPAARGEPEGRKKISFKDPIDDDPLADLSSDGEDPYTARKPHLAKSNRLADLFGIKNSETVEKIAESVKPSHVPKIEVPREKLIGEEINPPVSVGKKDPSAVQTASRSTLRNFKEPNETEETVPKIDDAPRLPSSRDRKSTLMEDMFGPRGRSAPARETETRSGVSKLGLENPASSVLPEPPRSEKSARNSGGYVLEPSTTREPRRGRRNSPIISDPLGLFAAPSKEQESAVDAGPKAEDSRPEKSSPPDDLPEWLGGAAKSKDKSENTKQPGGNTSAVSQNIIGSKSNVPGAQDVRQPIEPSGLSAPPIRDIFQPEMSMLIGSEFDQQAAIISMQQQEHELRTAANLARQNEQMTRIVESQRSKLDEQEKTFNVLIKRQIERQSMLETQMRIQQARIDHYIQTLMAQPTSLPAAASLEEKIGVDDRGNEEKAESPESLVKKLQLETDYLENTLERLKEKHEKEIQMLEDSYEKQITFMRQSTEKLEKKMLQANESLESDYERRIEKLKAEKEQLEHGYRQEIERLKKNEIILAEEIHARHSHNIELLEKEHAETIDGITRAKELERLAVESITSHKNDLGDLLERSRLVVDSFQLLQKKLEDKDEQSVQSRECYLRKQEENLQLLRDQLNLQQEAVTEERKRLAESCQRLDTATVNLTAEFTKRSSTINETEERLATRERALIRERQLFDEQMKWERDHLQATKETWMKEQERQTKLIADEREAIATERTKLQVLSRLQNGSDNMAKVELEAALKTAREAADAANLERRKWQDRCNSLETQKRAIREKERRLLQRAKELENLTQSALTKRDEGLRALKEAQRVDQQHKERLGQLQAQLESLAERENKLATEKLALARERLAARFVLAEKPEKDDTNERMHYRNERSLISNSIGSTHFKDVVDPHLLLLKLNLDNKLDTSDELLAAMNMFNQ